MHDSHFNPMKGVHYSVDPTPGRHTIGAAPYCNMTRLWEKVSWAPPVKIYSKNEEYEATDRKALKSVAGSCYKQIIGGIGGCLFAQIMGVRHWQAIEWLNAATGWDKNPDEYRLEGQRMQTLRQLFNVKTWCGTEEFQNASPHGWGTALEGRPLGETTSTYRVANVDIHSAHNPLLFLRIGGDTK
jgi:aldehyde:ferredoxin oxidoreductase